MTRQTQRQRHFNLSNLQVTGAIIMILAAIAVPRFLSNARATPMVSSDRAAIAAAFSEIRTAETAYQARNGEYADLLSLRNSGVRMMGAGQLSFRFSVQADDATHYFVTASPILASPGSHYYYTDEAGITFESRSATAAPAGDTSGQTPDGFVPMGS